MPLQTTRAIILRTYRVGEADKVVVFLTQDHGKVRGMAKGARRLRSRFGSSLEVGTEVEATYFEQEGRELVSLNRCDIIRSGFAVSADPLLACTLAYFTELADGFAQEKEPNEKLYRLIRAALDALIAGADPGPVARYFEAWLLRLGGYYPRGKRCARCGAELLSRGARYRLEEHRLLCRDCAASSGGLSVSAASLRYLEAIWTGLPARLAAPEGGDVLRELAALHKKIIGRELEREPRAQAVMDEMLEAGNAS